MLGEHSTDGAATLVQKGCFRISVLCLISRSFLALPAQGCFRALSPQDCHRIKLNKDHNYFERHVSHLPG